MAHSRKNEIIPGAEDIQTSINIDEATHMQWQDVLGQSQKEK